MLDRRTKVDPFVTVSSYEDETGYVVWRRGTGDNVELLHIHTAERGKGYGRNLVYRMLDELKYEPPYHSVFGFTRVSNDEAKKFYAALGFELVEVPGVYEDRRAILFWQEYDVLVTKMETYRGRPV